MLTNLSIGNADETLINQLVSQRVTGLAFHDVALCCFIGQGDGRNLVKQTDCYGCAVCVELGLFRMQLWKGVSGLEYLFGSVFVWVFVCDM